MKPAGLISLVLILLAGSCAPKCSTETVNVRVTGKEIRNTPQTMYYYIYTDKTTYTLKDSLLDMNFDISDDYGKIKEGKCYELFVRGWRVPFLSMYENIGDIKPRSC